MTKCCACGGHYLPLKKDRLPLLSACNLCHQTGPFWADLQEEEAVNHVNVIAHGDPNSFVRRVQHNPGVAVELLAACKKMLTIMEMQEKREAEEFHLSAEAFRPLWDEAKSQARQAIKHSEEGVQDGR